MSYSCTIIAWIAFFYFSIWRWISHSLSKLWLQVHIVVISISYHFLFRRSGIKCLWGYYGSFPQSWHFQFGNRINIYRFKGWSLVFSKQPSATSLSNVVFKISVRVRTERIFVNRSSFDDIW